MAFRTKEVVQLTGVNEKTLHYWDRTGLVRPSVQRGTGRGSRKLYSFRDLVAVTATVRLRRDGVSGRVLRRVINYIKRRSGIRSVDQSIVLVAEGTVVKERTAAELTGFRGHGEQSYLVVFDLPAVVLELKRRLAID